MPAWARHQAAAASGSSQVENGTGVLPCLRRLKRSSSAAATVLPSMTSAAAGSWNTALIPSTQAMATPLGLDGGQHRPDQVPVIPVPLVDRTDSLRSQSDADR